MMTVDDNRGTTTDHLGGSISPAVNKQNRKEELNS